MTIPVGRFAPTPSGPLHLGSLVTALGSFLSVRSRAGLWKLRIDDLDVARNQPGAEAEILRQLEVHGLEWDGAPRRQSDHVPEYEIALDQLRRQGRLYACRCTRTELARHAVPGPDEAVYPGTCRDLGLADVAAALRVRTPERTLHLEDPARGVIARRLDQDIGDFVVRRRDQQIAYQLACAIDESAQGVTEVVRGADLIGSSFRQVHLMHCLDLPVPRYLHLPLVMDSAGRKLSKQNHARALDSGQPADNLIWALQFLGQPAPPELAQGPVGEILANARGTWPDSRLATAAQQIT